MTTIPSDSRTAGRINRPGDRVVAWVKPTIDAPDASKYLHQPKSESGFEQQSRIWPR